MTTSRLLAASSILCVLLAILWFSQQAWLVIPKAYQAQAQLAQALGLQPLSANRPDLLNIASHAKLRDDSNHSHYVIHGQIHNPNAVPLHTPSIVLQQIGPDNRLIRQLNFAATTWQKPLQPIAANTLVEFALPVTIDSSSTSNESWGYQLQLRD